MATVFIFHGIYGHPGENWFPWMKRELEAKDCTVIIPEFPHPGAPTLEEWLEFFSQFEVSPDTIFVGHSLGSAFALRALLHFKKPIKACFLAASVWEVMNNQFDPEMSTFTTAPYDWKLLKSLCSSFTVMHGESDPYITPEKSEALARHLGVPVMTIPGGGHFNESAGCTEFPALRDLILRV